MPSDGQHRVPGQARPAALPYQIMPMPKARDDEVGDHAQPFLAAVRQHIEQHVEAEMVVFAHADGGAEEDEPAHQHDRAGLGPARRVVQHIAAEDLPGDDDRHQHEPDAGEVERRGVEPGQNARRRCQRAPDDGALLTASSTSSALPVTEPVPTCLRARMRRAAGRGRRHASIAYCTACTSATSFFSTSSVTCFS